jgi:hypothetical protein
VNKGTLPDFTQRARARRRLPCLGPSAGGLAFANLTEQIYGEVGQATDDDLRTGQDVAGRRVVPVGDGHHLHPGGDGGSDPAGGILDRGAGRGWPRHVRSSASKMERFSSAPRPEAVRQELTWSVGALMDRVGANLRHGASVVLADLRPS